MESWESSGQWMFSTYSPMKEKPNISGRIFPNPLNYPHMLRFISHLNTVIGSQRMRSVLI